MKKLLIIYILIVSIIFISGCTSDETNSESSTSSQTNSQSDLILRSSDVPGFVIQEYSFMSYPKDLSYNFNDEKFLTGYTDVLPEGKRNVGQYMKWEDKTNGRLTVAIRKYDSNSGIEEYLKGQELLKNNPMEKEEFEQWKILTEFEEGNLKIGDYSYYLIIKNTYGYTTKLNFYNDYGVCQMIINLDNKDKSKNEAIRIAKLIESRLD